ncbi:LytTR family DNA-binding domain-containing protein [Spirosoma sp. 209]|uniref:LytR/AlgR family response regulator transcription factor n=1 Tax=Spirosoma sp. 209 TaxID=1955701 RepID=UPI00098D38C0|nr:LytTR family DNA-binding domain-containing protein [Spirosoma sp. 209]
MINVVLVDDEQLSLDILGQYIDKTLAPAMQVVGSFRNPRKALEAILTQSIGHPVDLILLDIEMNELNGMDFVRQLRGRYKVILTTGRTEYALESYNYDIADYLLKPIAYDRFLRAVQKVFDPTATMPLHVGMIPPQRSEQQGTVSLIDDSLVLDVTKIDRGTTIRLKKRVRFKDIIRIESDKNYVDIFLPEERITALISLNDMQNMLPTHQFVRVHKSHIISIDHFDSLHENTIYLTGSVAVPLGGTFRDAFNKIIADRFDSPFRTKR